MCKKSTRAVHPTWDIRLAPVSEDKGHYSYYYSMPRGGQRLREATKWPFRACESSRQGATATPTDILPRPVRFLPVLRPRHCPCRSLSPSMCSLCQYTHLLWSSPLLSTALPLLRPDLSYTSTTQHLMALLVGAHDLCMTLHVCQNLSSCRTSLASVFHSVYSESI
jgi:hypothetical protein